ncbi:MAG: hypothetical protein KGJ56_06295 [Gammaproteobacteria bacterium]|nr:hypothetical protein [Gammaproteobacteria bacterium]
MPDTLARLRVLRQGLVMPADPVQGRQLETTRQVRALHKNHVAPAAEQPD